MDHALPDSSTIALRDAVAMMTDGRFRMPPFQRPYVWTADQAVALLGSIAAGLPVGAIVVVEAPAEAGPERIGPLRVAAPPLPAAWWIVDGAQRLGTLAGALAPDDAVGPEAVRLACDLDSGAVIRQRVPAEPLDLPFSVLLEPDAFRAWLSERGPQLAPDTYQRALDLRSRINEYALTVVRLSNTAVEASADLFVRLNSHGTSLSTDDLAHARRPNAGAPERTLASVAAGLARAGFGRLPERSLISAVQVVGAGGGPPGQPLADAEESLERVLTWLRLDAGIPHVSVWEKHLDLLPPLVGFFHLHRLPSARARILLNRWLWRSMGSAHHREVTRQLFRGADSLDATLLLRQAPASEPGPDYMEHLGFRLALSSLAPRSLLNGNPLPVAEMLQAEGEAVFRELAGVPFFSPPGEGPLAELIAASARHPDVLASHALDARAVELWKAHDLTAFRRHRHRLLARATIVAAQPRAQWGASDRPAINDLLVADDEEDLPADAR